MSFEKVPEDLVKDRRNVELWRTHAKIGRPIFDLAVAALDQPRDYELRIEAA